MCDHDLVVIGRMKARDNQECLAVACGKCNRQWHCEPINFAPMGEPPRYTPPEY